MTTVHGTSDAAGLHIALVCSRFNDLVVDRLADGARNALLRHGAAEGDVDTVWVPGAWEIPLAAAALATTGRYDAIVGIGAVLRGATYHFEVIANHSAAGLARVAHDTGVVVTNGIITVDTMEQALDRAGGKAGNKGAEAALAAVETVTAIRAAAASAGGARAQAG
ncbi:MAG: 6,7-dimethyl-8-ribityllumazine synthase [Acidimicrobiaceae bacterium]|nr:6,7-dimethyl-8-ribityllumazine synthase [Ilumatobacter sp.]MCB9380844.1 6,7-dimethyl-8-ribityllumazine synthase [Acidimicrobiaceae bacterium]MCO5329877.1 6,7-dimethyl-8-ribityllumazine synthase [Ilumatobacteraceae bacterium]